MNVVVTAIVMIALVAIVASSLLSLASRPLFRAISSLRARARVRWLLAALAAPLLCGVCVVILALGHCVAHRVFGIPDDCPGPGCTFCLFALGPTNIAAMLVALVAMSPLLMRSATIASGLLRARRAQARLRAVARPGPQGVWLVPGAQAFVLGWPSSVICIGDELTQGLAPIELRAMTEHEHAHQLRGDVALRMVARALAAAQLPGIGRSLLASIDLAIEQACDEHASEAVADPLVVADALIGAARLQGCEGTSVAASLPARIEALCAGGASGASRAPWTLGLASTLACLSVVAVLYGHQIHRAAETVASLIGR